MTNPEESRSGTARPPFQADLADLPHIPAPHLPWRATLFFGWVGVIIFAIAGIVKILMQKWYTQSIGLESVFTTNFGAGLVLFLVWGIIFAAAVLIPTRMYAKSARVRRVTTHFGIWAFVLGGGILSWSYHPFLLFQNGIPFGKTDPIFGADYGFYVFKLPFFWYMYWAAFFALLTAMVFFLVSRIDTLSREDGAWRRPEATFGRRIVLIANRGFYALFVMLGVWGAIGTFMYRYRMLYDGDVLDMADTAMVLTGPSLVDVSGIFSKLNTLYASAIVELVVAVLFGYVMYRGYCAIRNIEEPGATPREELPWKRRAVWTVALLIIFDAGMFAAVRVRQILFVAPSEPYVQKEYIEHHIAATRDGFDLEKVEVVEWTPPEEPVSAEELATSVSVRKAPIVPGFASFGNRKRDAYQSFENALYAPSLEIFQQQQQLRPYYSFLNVDHLRYVIDGEKELFTSAVRELPTGGQVDRGAYNWGTKTLLFTHGHGLVVSPSNRVKENGEPEYVASNIPMESDMELFANIEHPEIYYGEGSVNQHVMTNIRYLEEFNHTTGQSRTESVFPSDIEAGIPVDSFFKRVIFGLWAIQPGYKRYETAHFMFSRFIDTEKTRLHVYRSPKERIWHVAPFLVTDDTSNVAAVCDNRITWIANCMTKSMSFPYSRYRGLDVSDMWGNGYQVNYIRDSVKVSIDAYTGDMKFYKYMKDEPILDTWAKIYPDMFLEKSAMPSSVADQVSYPLTLFHCQFDDIYKRYHMTDYLDFYNLEDLWDDADEVLGTVSDLKTVAYEATSILVDPADLPAGIDLNPGKGGSQYVMYQPFTPKWQLNLRSMIMVFQDAENYGKAVSLQIPKGAYFAAPEQIDAMIDADAAASQQFALWTRTGSEVLNGHTLMLPVKGDMLYIEPIYARSTLNPIPQIRCFCVVYRGRVTMARDLDDAVRQLGVSPREIKQLPHNRVGKAAGSGN